VSVLAAAILLDGCGGVTAADLFLLERTGSGPGQHLVLLVNEEVEKHVGEEEADRVRSGRRVALGAFTVIVVAELGDLMARYCDGDTSAFRELYAAVAPRLLGYLVKMTRSRAVADDLLQQTFLKVHRARAAYTMPMVTNSAPIETSASIIIRTNGSRQWRQV